MAYDWLNATETPSYGYGWGGYGMPMGGGYGMLPWQMPQQNSIGGMLKSGAAARYNFQGMDLGQMRGISDEISRLGRAQYDMDDPLYQKTFAAERDAGMQDFSAALAEAQRQNRKAGQLGRTPLFSPERGGEMQFRAMTKGYQEVQNDARMRARQILGAGQQAAGRSFDAATAMATAKDQNKKKKAFGMGNIADALPLLMRGLG